jgi:hypothetical protein
MISLQIRSLELGYRYLVRDVDACEVWTVDHMLIAEFPGHLLLTLLFHHLAAADSTARLHEALAAGEASRMPLFPSVSYRGLAPVADRKVPLRRQPVPESRPITPGERAALRVARRRRRKP